MKLRLLCSGECNIRVDLLLFYPLLMVLSTSAIVVVLRHPGTHPPDSRSAAMYRPEDLLRNCRGSGPLARERYRLTTRAIDHIAPTAHAAVSTRP